MNRFVALIVGAVVGALLLPTAVLGAGPVDDGDPVDTKQELSLRDGECSYQTIDGWYRWNCGAGGIMPEFEGELFGTAAVSPPPSRWDGYAPGVNDGA